MILSTLNTMPNKEFQVLGLVQGSLASTKEIGVKANIKAGKSIKDSIKSGSNVGEMKPYSEMLEEAREIAKQRMIEQANELKADAIIDIKFSFNFFHLTIFEILVYGTAIKFI